MIAADDLVDFAPRRADAGQVRCRQQLGFSQDAGDGGMGALAGRTAGAIGHGDEVGRERRQTLDRLPQAALHLLGLRREELERDRRGFKRAVPVRYGRRNLGHGTTNSTKRDVRLGRRSSKLSQTGLSKQPILNGKLPNFCKRIHNIRPVIWSLGTASLVRRSRNVPVKCQFQRNWSVWAEGAPRIKMWAIDHLRVGFMFRPTHLVGPVTSPVCWRAPDLRDRALCRPAPGH